jgi:nitroreductase
MAAASSDVWEVMSTARTIRRFTEEPVDDATYGGEQLLRDAVGVPDDWMLAGHIVVGWPKGRRGPLRRRPLAAAVNFDRWAYS